MKLRELEKTLEVFKNKSFLFKGIEREFLRIDKYGDLSTKRHPTSLGSPLTHPNITLDYAESMIELVTDVYSDTTKLINDFKELHSYTLNSLEKDELLWPCSLPPKLPDHIKLAEFGKSNSARMKKVYRKGLRNRYSDKMQMITGIHYNLSFDKDFLELFVKNNAPKLFLSMKEKVYFKILQNIKRESWFLIYLFGSSPGNNKNGISSRLGKNGYRNKLPPNYLVPLNDLSSYTSELQHLIRTPHLEWQKMGIKDSKGLYLQLNDSILQIENEFYSTVRPKQVMKRGESPSYALLHRGVNHIELRMIDINPFSTIGISKEQIELMDLFFIYSLIRDNFDYSKKHQLDSDENEKLVADNGKDRNIILNKENNEKISLQDWTDEIFDNLIKIANVVDKATGSNKLNIVKYWQDRHNNKDLNADRLSSNSTQKIEYAKMITNEIKKTPIKQNTKSHLDKLCKDSIEQTLKIETSENLNFEEYVSDYFSIARHL